MNEPQALTEFPAFIHAMPEIEIPIPGARGWMVQDGRRQVIFVEFDRTTEVPDHSHDAQWETPVCGTVELRREGSTQVHGPGESFYIPAGQVHGATVQAGYSAVIAFDAPDRYRPKE